MSMAITDREYINQDFNLLTSAAATESQNRIAPPQFLWTIPNFPALSRCGSQSAKFVKYDSLVGLRISLT